jgi:hypothetical protein
MTTFVRAANLHMRAKCRACDDPVRLRTFHTCHVIAAANQGEKSVANSRVGCAPCNLDCDTRDFEEYCVEERGIASPVGLPALMPLATAETVMDWLFNETLALKANMLRRSQCIHPAFTGTTSALLESHFLPEDGIPA